MNKLNYNILNDVIKISKKILKVIYIFLICIIIFIGLKIIKESGLLIIFKILKILIPLLIAFVISWLLNPLVEKLENKFNRTISCMIVLGSIILIIGIILYLLIPILYNELIELSYNIPNYIDSINNTQISIKINEYINNIDIPNTLLNLFSKFISLLGTIGLTILFTLYLLIDYKKVIKYICKLIPNNKCSEINKLLEDISNEVRKCINGTFLVAIIVFISDALLFSLFGLKLSILLGFVCGLTDLIPYIGPYIGGIIAIILAYSQSKKLAIIITIIVIVVQLIENFILQPIIMSKSTKIHPVIIILSLTIFGYFFGIIGMLIATPLISLLKVIYKYIKDKTTLQF